MNIFFRILGTMAFAAVFFLNRLVAADGIADELALDPDGINVGSDWWKYLVMALGVILVVYLLIRLTLFVMRLIGVLICLAAGVVGGAFAQIFNASLETRLPDSIQRFTPVISGLAGFLLFFMIASLVMSIIRKPAEKAKEK